MINHTIADTAPVWTFRLRSRGEAFDLGAPGAAVAARVKLADGTFVSRVAEIMDPDAGEIAVTWESTDLTVEGLAKLDFLYTASGGVAQHARSPLDVWVRAEYNEPETP